MTPSKQSTQRDQSNNTVTEQVKQGAQQAAGQARMQAQSIVAGQKQNAAQNLTSVSQALHQTGQQLQQQGQGTASQMVDGVAERIDHFAHYVQHTNVDQMVREAQDFARREPAIFLGGAFALGFLLSRFLKSAPPGQQSGPGGYGTSYRGTRYPRGQYRGSEVPYAYQDLSGGPVASGYVTETIVEDYQPDSTETDYGQVDEPTY